MTKLKVIYYGGKVNEELDIAIEKALKKIGFARWASGCNLQSGERDLAFEKKEKGI